MQINELIREVGGLMQTAASKNQVEMLTELTTDLPAAMGDRVQVQQVILNLLMNGIEALKETDGPRQIVVSSLASSQQVVA